MKVGFQLNFIGNQITLPENQPGIIPININPVQTIDFILSGTIQNTATLFFTWENLLNKKYFFIPYFPMPERNIRFGVSWEFLN
jgi:outer membrane cobalamin receptor